MEQGPELCGLHLTCSSQLLTTQSESSFWTGPASWLGTPLNTQPLLKVELIIKVEL